MQLCRNVRLCRLAAGQRRKDGDVVALPQDEGLAGPALAGRLHAVHQHHLGLLLVNLQAVQELLKAAVVGKVQVGAAADCVGKLVAQAREEADLNLHRGEPPVSTPWCGVGPRFGATAGQRKPPPADARPARSVVPSRVLAAPLAT